MLLNRGVFKSLSDQENLYLKKFRYQILLDSIQPEVTFIMIVQI
jgi:hypothetical protein